MTRSKKEKEEPKLNPLVKLFFFQIKIDRYIMIINFNLLYNSFHKGACLCRVIFQKKRNSFCYPLVDHSNVTGSNR